MRERRVMWRRHWLTIQSNVLEFSRPVPNGMLNRQMCDDRIHLQRPDNVVIEDRHETAAGDETWFWARWHAKGFGAAYNQQAIVWQQQPWRCQVFSMAR